MKAVILLTTNPTFEKDAYAILEEVSKRKSLKGVKIVSVAHLFGRFDGMVIIDYSDAKALNSIAEALRENGVFHTETLIAIE